MPEMVGNKAFSLRAPNLEKLLILTQSRDKIKIISDMAFDALDEDGSGGLDVQEISVIMDDVAEKMGVTAPTQEDLEEIL